MSLLTIGTSALMAAQSSLNTASNNISNVNTDGYSRQRTNQSTLGSQYSGNGYIGNGVTVTSVSRIYDNFIAEQVRNYTSQSTQEETFLKFSSQVDDLLSSSGLSINTSMEEFFNAVYEVSNDPTSVAARQVLLTQGELLASSFNTIDKQMSEYDSQIDDTITVTLLEINQLAEGVSALNQAILAAPGTGGTVPNDLLDQRDLLITQLSELVSVTTLVEDNGSINVFVGNGQALVVGASTIKLSAIADNSTVPPRVGIGYGPNAIDVTAQITGGSIGGALQVRTEVIDTTRADLDELASAFVTAFNTIQTAGVDLDGVAGTNFFDPTGTTAASINVILTDPNDIAASSTANAGDGNNVNALAMAELQTDDTMGAGTQTFSEHYSVTVAEVATRTHQAEVSQQTQEGLLAQLQASYASVSGVNLDEEAANLIKYQQAYQAASQIITASNTIFNALINAM